MTGPSENSQFCFPKTFNAPRGEGEGNIGVEGKQNSPFSVRPFVKCFVIPPNSKMMKKSFACCCQLAHKFSAIFRLYVYNLIKISKVQVDVSLGNCEFCSPQEVKEF